MSRWKVGVIAGFLAAFGIVDWQASAAGTDNSVLDNPGFEAGTNEVAAAWSAFGKHATRNADYARSGSYSGKATGEFNGQANFAGFMQDFDSKPGDQWVGSVWIRENSEDPLMGQAEAFAKIEFYDKDGTFIDALESADRIGAVAPKDDFVPSKVTTVAPARTARVRFVAMFAQFDGHSKGTVYFDDCEFHKVEKNP